MDRQTDISGATGNKLLRDVAVVIAAALVVVVAIFTTRTPAAYASHAGCGGSPPVATGAMPRGAAAVAIDGSISTNGRELRQSYRGAALAAVQVAAAHEWAARIVVFGASGVGARVIFSGSFMPVSTVYAFNVAARNRLLCLAKKALASAFVSRIHLAGTDVAGAIAEQLAWGRSVVRSHGRVSLLALTDGCEAPARSGANAHLTDLCPELRKGRSPGWILKHNRREFSLGHERGVHITMEGVGVGRDQSAASTLQAEKLVAFWGLACRRSRAVCKIASAVS